MFTPRFARHAAKRYRKRNLDKTAQRMVSFLDRQGIKDATVLEIGGGVGELHIELLRRGAARAVSLELSSGYDAEARTLLANSGLEERVERRLHDIAADPAGVAAADVVVLHRVVCCYPDYQRLLAAVADHAKHFVVFSYPPRNVPGRLLVAWTNFMQRVRRLEYRAFVHPPKSMLAQLEQRGLHQSYAYRRLVWHVAGFERSAPVSLK